MQFERTLVALQNRDHGEQRHGLIELELTDRTFRLAKGDYLQFPGSLKHKLRGVQRHSSVLVVIVGDRNTKGKI